RAGMREVRDDLVELDQGGRLEDALQPVLQVLGGEATFREVFVELGGEALPVRVRRSRARCFGLVAIRRSGGVARRQIPMRWARSSRW
ncbi:MAG TPA: hypothetical protein VGS21_01960, partial [Acidimicrobiales bacterium]|nr:hypothetical protein [Acidimicrobiales bacterium]